MYSLVPIKFLSLKVPFLDISEAAEIREIAAEGGVAELGVGWPDVITSNFQFSTTHQQD